MSHLPPRRVQKEAPVQRLFGNSAIIRRDQPSSSSPRFSPHLTVLPPPARNALRDYLETRPPVPSTKVFIGERGPMTDFGIRALCQKYSAVIGVRLHPHVFRHTFAKQFLADNGNDLVSLAQVLGHEDLNTTSRYGQKSEQQLAAGVDRVTY